MNYELAKELKEAGFRSQSLVMICPHGMTDDVTEILEECKYSKVPLPSLSELIEACRGSFGALMVGPGLGLWTAKGNGIEIHSKTPEEAIARLWLVLNQNQVIKI